MRIHPPANLPAGDALSQFLCVPEVKATPAPKSCAECGLVSDEDCSKCTACKTVAYCSADCQRKHWPIHKPDCLRAQGKEVPDKVAAKALRKLEEKAALEQSRNDQEREQVTKQFMENFSAYANEQPGDHWAHDCSGKRLQIHVPTIYADQMIGNIGKLYLQLREVQIVSLGMFPDGIDPDKYGFRGSELKDPRNDARILVLFERLFADEGRGGGVGLHIDGVFVVEKVVRGRAVSGNWFQSPRHRTHQVTIDCTVGKIYLEVAKGRAKSVPETADLGYTTLEIPICPRCLLNSATTLIFHYK